MVDKTKYDEEIMLCNIGIAFNAFVLVAIIVVIIVGVLRA